jgi:acetyl-CoA C-acetyltransferase
MTEEHANSTDRFNSVIGGRIKISDCSQVTDGAICIFLASKRYAEKYAKGRGLDINKIPQIIGWGHHTAPIGFETRSRRARTTRTSSRSPAGHRRCVQPREGRRRLGHRRHRDP